MKTILKVNLIISIIMTIWCGILTFFPNVGKIGVESILLNLVVMFILFFAVINIPFLPYYIHTIVKEWINKQYVDKKETIYTRELPEEYNSVIAGELFDFKSSFKGEYVAGTIELINKGYITEGNGKLSVNKEKSTEGLLKNEKYILDTCTQINTSSYFNYSQGFFENIRDDMLDLGLYRKNMLFEILEKIKSKLGYIPFKIITNSYLRPNLIIAIWLRKRRLTPKGENEKEKIAKLKLYFDKETNFSEKTDIERKVWGRYSAFAIALESNKKMKEEIFDKYFKYRKA